MAVRIDAKLNLALEVERSDGTTLHVHATPLSALVFKRYFWTISKVYAATIENGHSFILAAGPRVAALLLEKIATDDGVWDGPDGVERGLVAEMRRLTSIVFLGANGWEPVLFDEAVKSGLLEAEDASEVENILTFFTVLSLMARRAEREKVVEASATPFGARTTSSTVSALIASLSTSTATAGTSPSPKASSLPS